jgi:hypothetical protein
VRARVKVVHSFFETFAVVVPRHAARAARRSPFEQDVSVAQKINIDVMEQRGDGARLAAISQPSCACRRS